MSESLRGLLAAGTRLAHDGQWWRVAELNGPDVLLSGASGVRRVGAGHLLADPSTRLDGAPADPVGSTGAELAGLGEAELAELRERVAHVQEVRTGFRGGCAELAAAGEPRPEYADRRADTCGCTLDSAANVKAGHPPERAPEPRQAATHTAPWPRFPSAMRPWTPQHHALQRYKMTHHGTKEKRPAGARIRS